MTVLPGFLIVSVVFAGMWMATAGNENSLIDFDLTVVVNGSGKGSKSIDAHAFDGVNHITILDLADNKFTEIPEFVSTKLTKVKHFNLSRNSLSTTVNAFAHCRSLITLDVSNNPHLTRFDSNYFVGLTSESTVKLGGDRQITEIKCDAFGDKTTGAIRETASNRKTPSSYADPSGKSAWREFQLISHVSNDALEKIVIWHMCAGVPDGNSHDYGMITITKKMKKINKGWFFAGMGVDTIKREAEIIGFIGFNLAAIGIEEIGSGAFDIVPKFKKLILDRNDIKDTKIVANLPSSIEILSMMNNSIIELGARSFSHIKEMQRLDLRYNKIVTVKSGAFEGNDNLIVLNLEGNQISNLERGCFTGLEVLEKLFLAGNKLTIIWGGVFVLPNLRELDLTSNQIGKIQPGSVGRLGQLEILDVDKNSIEYLENGSLFGLPTNAKCSIKIMGKPMKYIEGGVFDEKKIPDCEY